MKKRILNYLKETEELLSQPPNDINWDTTISQHLIQIRFFQHERLIHLIAMVLFALMTVITLIGMMISFHQSLVVLFGSFLVLLIPYISHYYLLENSVQKMYEQYDKMLFYKQNQEN